MTYSVGLREDLDRGWQSGQLHSGSSRRREDLCREGSQSGQFGSKSLEDLLSYLGVW